MIEDFSPHQQKIIKRYYSNQDTLQLQKLSELVTELFLAEGKTRAKVWKSVTAAMQKLGVSATRINHLVQQDNPALIAELVKELQRKS
jgi:hypothetical protein